MNTTQLDAAQTNHLSELANATQRGRGRGLDYEPEAQRALALVDWLEAATERAILESEGFTIADDIIADIVAARAEIAATITAEQDTGKRILALAGGAGWGDGRHVVKFNGSGMAARAARYLYNRRGNRPSQTSLEEAAATGAGAMWYEWQCWQAVFGDDVQFDTARHRLCGVAWRAAYGSMTRDASEGRTGRKAGQGEQDNGAAMPLEGAALDIARKSLAQWAQDRQGRIFNPGAMDEQAKQRRARRRVLSWVASVLDVRAKGRTGAAERARFSVIARLVHGRDIASASRGAGFANGRQAIESFRTGKVWSRLKIACANHRGEAERALLALRKRTAKRAAQAIKAQRRVATGAGAFQVLTYGTAERVIRSRVVIGNPLATEWSQATTARGEAVAQAHVARAIITKARRERANQFDNATKGLRAGWLRN